MGSTAQHSSTLVVVGGWVDLKKRRRRRRREGKQISFVLFLLCTLWACGEREKREWEKEKGEKRLVRPQGDQD